METTTTVTALNENLNEAQSASQRVRILGWLQEGNSITPKEALFRFGCFRLSARIADIREEGWKVRTDIVTDESTGKHFASYTLES